MSARSLMIQGTASSVGKSLLVTALCRIFNRRGLRVAPFKAQNMSLNTFACANGGYIGIAQAIQAEAAGILPDVRMNPVLLCPTSEKTSKVLLNGELLTTLDAQSYHTYRARLLAPVIKAYNSLAAEYDLILLEGAGSPAEINLREHDLANMGIAEAVDAPVLLVGDIDRGGVFASLYGTIALLKPEERTRIHGVIINKFRGDKTILEPGLCQLIALINKPVLGVIPYLSIFIDEEDSLVSGIPLQNSTDMHMPISAVALAGDKNSHKLREAEYDRLATAVEEHLGIDAIWEAIGDPTQARSEP